MGTHKAICRDGWDRIGSLKHSTTRAPLCGAKNCVDWKDLAALQLQLIDDLIGSNVTNTVNNATTMKSMNIKHTKSNLLVHPRSACTIKHPLPLHLVLVKIFGNDYYGKWPQAMLDNTMPAIRGNSSTIERHPAPGSQTRMQNRVHPLLSLPITNVLVGLLRNCLACVWPAPLKLVSALSVCWATIFFSLIALTQLDFKCFTLELISSSCFSEIVLHLFACLS